jgi:hypothetical protein
MEKKEDSGDEDDDKEDEKDADEEESASKKAASDAVEEAKPSAEGKGDQAVGGGEPRALHKTASVFLRSIHPAVTKAEIEKVNLIR